MIDVLYSFSKRAVSIGPDGIGWVPVLMRPGRRPPGMRGRLFCGIGKSPDPQPKASAKKKAKKQEEEEPDPRKSFIDKLPPEIQKELKLGVPDQLVGRSALAFKKLVRYLVRCRLGSVEVDICNAFFQLLHKIVPLPVALAEYLAIGHALLSGLESKERRKEAKRNPTFFGSTVSSNIHLNTEERPFHKDSTSSSEAQREKSDLRRFEAGGNAARIRCKAKLQGRQKWPAEVPR